MHEPSAPARTPMRTRNRLRDLRQHPARRRVQCRETRNTSGAAAPTISTSIHPLRAKPHASIGEVRELSMRHSCPPSGRELRRAAKRAHLAKDPRLAATHVADVCICGQSQRIRNTAAACGLCGSSCAALACENSAGSLPRRPSVPRPNSACSDRPSRIRCLLHASSIRTVRPASRPLTEPALASQRNMVLRHLLGDGALHRAIRRPLARRSTSALSICFEVEAVVKRNAWSSAANSPLPAACGEIAGDQSRHSCRKA
jgi:hypothetical protein